MGLMIPRWPTSSTGTVKRRSAVPARGQRGRLGTRRQFLSRRYSAPAARCARLLLDDGLDQVADGQHAHHAAGFTTGKCRKRPSVMSCMQWCTVSLGETLTGRSRHDVVHRRVMRRAVLQNHLTGVIALGNDADQRSLLMTRSAPTCRVAMTSMACNTESSA
jgi:hypothetical protein